MQASHARILQDDIPTILTYHSIPSVSRSVYLKAQTKCLQDGFDGMHHTCGLCRGEMDICIHILSELHQPRLLLKK